MWEFFLSTVAILSAFSLWALLPKVDFDLAYFVVEADNSNSELKVSVYGKVTNQGFITVHGELSTYNLEKNRDYTNIKFSNHYFVPDFTNNTFLKLKRLDPQFFKLGDFYIERPSYIKTYEDWNANQTKNQNEFTGKEVDMLFEPFIVNKFFELKVKHSAFSASAGFRLDEEIMLRSKSELYKAGIKPRTKARVRKELARAVRRKRLDVTNSCPASAPMINGLGDSIKIEEN